MHHTLRKGLLVALTGTAITLCSAPSWAAPPVKGAPPRVSATQSERESGGLETVEALLEDLSFRNLELHDREATRKASHSASKGGTLVVSVGDWTATLPSAVSGAPAGAKAGIADAANLAAYVNLLARRQPGGTVCGSFSDWRTTSVYRAVAGRHYGYDIAYPPGTPIAVGWAGQVVAIANWYGAEHGITVQSPHGFRVTYGHLAPATHVGAWVNPGDVVGRVVRDHVDVKMRGTDGAFVDFAHGIPGGGGSYIAAPAHGGLASRGSGVVLNIKIRGGPSLPRLLPPLSGPAWTRREPSVRAAIAYLRLRYQEAALLARGAESDGGALAAVRRQVDEVRGRLLVNAVPEDVLLAAFVGAPGFERMTAGSGDEPASDGLVEVNRPASQSPDLGAAARNAVPRLHALLGELNAQPPAPRS